MKYVPHDYQAHATQHIIDNPAAGLLLDMGLGKTVATLTAIKDLMYNSCEVEKVLVIAPKRVAEDTWPKEVTKWDHLKNLRVSLVLGTPRQRIEALRRKADIYVINRENVVWLVTYFQSAFPFDMLVIDESSSFKNYKSARFKALRSVRPGINRVVNLTGTPTPNGLLDLWSQMYLLDRGQRLGKTISQYRDEYFKPTRRKGHVIYEWALLQGDDVTGEDIYERRIYDKISDICISMKSEDYLDLPDLLEIDVMIDLPAKDMQRYKDFERDLVLCMERVGLENAEDITAINATALSNKLRQFANGAVYDDEKNWKLVHNVKLAALVEDVEDLNGKPIIIFYQFRHDLERLQKALKPYKPRVLTKSSDIDDWNEGKINVFLLHAQSAGHGLNLQEGGNHTAWYGLDWGLEFYQQAIKRLHRQGQTQKVFMRRYLVRDTIEERVLKSLINKAEKQESLMQAVKAIVRQYVK